MMAMGEVLGFSGYLMILSKCRGVFVYSGEL